MLTLLLRAWVPAQTSFCLTGDAHLEGKYIALGKPGLAPFLGYEENLHDPVTLGENQRHDYSANTRL